MLITNALTNQNTKAGLFIRKSFSIQNYIFTLMLMALSEEEKGKILETNQWQIRDRKIDIQTEKYLQAK